MQNRATATVLAVSSNDADLSWLAGIFAHSNWKLVAAKTIADGMQVLSASTVCVVLCDDNFIQPDWTELLGWLKDGERPAAMILMSRAANDELWYKAFKLGADDVLAKPLATDEVLKAVAGAMRWHSRWPGRSAAAGGCELD